MTPYDTPQGCKHQDEQSFVLESEQSFANIFRPMGAGEVLYNCCTKFYPDGSGGWYPVKRVVFDRQTYNPNRAELRRAEQDSPDDITRNRSDSAEVSAKSYNRARQACFDYLMCNPDLDTFVTFTIDPAVIDSRNYEEVVRWLSVWLSNRVKRHGLKYILVPERHKSGAIHFHGITNRIGLKLVSSGYWKVGKYTLEWDRIAKKRQSEAQEIFNVKDLPLGFSTALKIEGEDAQTKISKYIWKYMTKQGRQKIGGRFYLHGGDLITPKLEYSNEYFSESSGVLVTYGGTSCKIENLG